MIPYTLEELQDPDCEFWRRNRMDKILYFDVEVDGLTRRIYADEFRYQGEYIAFWETVEPSAGGLAALPTKRLLTVLHRPEAVIPCYENAV